MPALAGPAGANGQLRVYGNGSAGALTVTTTGNLFTDYAADRNTQFSAITVDAGKVLSVPGGTVLRATGDVTINGTLRVLSQNPGGFLQTADEAFSTSTVPGYHPPGAGISSNPAGTGELGPNTAARLGGVGGRGLADGDLRIGEHLLRGGGGGAPAGTTVFKIGGTGAGAVMIVAGGTITVNGSIVASPADFSGNNGAGGGGGGVVVLASKAGVTNAGLIAANGGPGNPGGTQGGSGGGGGGGVILLAAPSVSAGTLQVNGGIGGEARGSGIITANPRIGGGGGGASGGNGGFGASAASNGSCTAGSDGSAGKTLVLQVDPTAML